MTAAYAEFLAVAGWNELKNIAIRYQRAFPTLLPSTYSRGKFFFQHTDTQRTQASFRAFADGLFGYNGYRDVFVEPIPQRDLLLRVNCTIIGRKKFHPTKAIQTFFYSYKSLSTFVICGCRTANERPRRRPSKRAKSTDSLSRMSIKSLGELMAFVKAETLCIKSCLQPATEKVIFKIQ